MGWTDEQDRVINLRNKNILVSAAAGSGKTSVLVERIIRRITDKENPISIDSLLVVTFTKAAASEMKERILAALSKKLNSEPWNEHLQKQMTLVHNAMITTIDSFCNSIVKDNFNALELDPSYRIADNDELSLIKSNIIDVVLEKKYDEGSDIFHQVIETLGDNRGDDKVEDIILSLYEFSRSHPYPNRWLDDCVDQYDCEGDISDKAWYKLMVEAYDSTIDAFYDNISKAIDISSLPDGPAMYMPRLIEDRDNISIARKEQNLYKKSAILMGLVKGKLARISDDNVSDENKKKVQSIRNSAWKAIDKLNSEGVGEYKDKLIGEIAKNKQLIEEIVSITKDYAEEFSAYKREKNIVDFSDIEHFALNILTEIDSNGHTVPSKIAIDMADEYEEVMIDEYQDSNYVQEYILSAISGAAVHKNNRFLVGDVKQSIYGFRMAEPQIFIDKYEEYGNSEDENNERIVLSTNFRSRVEVIDSVNAIFGKLMRQEIGGIEYDKNHYLNASDSVYKPIETGEMIDYTSEILITDVGDEADDKKAEEKRELELMSIIWKIRSLMEDSEFKIYDKTLGDYRRLKYGDIAILGRSIGRVADKWTELLIANGILATSEMKSGFYDTYEISSMISMLKFIDNPKRDIPCVAVMKNIYVFSPEDMALIKAHSKSNERYCFYDEMKDYADYLNSHDADSPLLEKIRTFIDDIEELVDILPHVTIDELIDRILEVTGFKEMVSTMPGGTRRNANICLLKEKAREYEKTSFSGLFNFVRYLKRIKKMELDSGEAALYDDDDSVHVMTVHKSKGLEFPVVFLALSTKNFNQGDMKKNVVLHSKLGIGIDYVDLEKRYKKSNPIKYVIKRAIKEDLYAEEIRILYVALTRAKEKLYITACDDYRGFLEEVDEYKNSHRDRLSESDIMDSKCLYEWIWKAVALDEGRPVAIKRIGIDELTVSEVENTLYAGEGVKLVEEQVAKVDRSIVDDLISQYDYEYPNIQDVHMKSKYSVSDIKKMNMVYASRMGEEEEQPASIVVPQFITKTEKLYGASRGTAYHRIFELLDYSQDMDSEESMKRQIEAMYDKGFIDSSIRDAIDVKRMLLFASSELGGRMQKAYREGKLRRESQYVMVVDGKDIDSDYTGEEKVLVQGIIDAFFEENGEIVIVDYKTDNVDKLEDLDGMYRSQLIYYKKAVSQLTGKRVKEMIIYSVRFDAQLAIVE